MNFKNFLKENWRQLILALLILSLGFALGFLYAQENNQAPIVIEKNWAGWTTDRSTPSSLELREN